MRQRTKSTCSYAECTLPLTVCTVTFQSLELWIPPLHFGIPFHSFSLSLSSSTLRTGQWPPPALPGTLDEALCSNADLAHVRLRALARAPIDWRWSYAGCSCASSPSAPISRSVHASCRGSDRAALLSSTAPCSGVAPRASSFLSPALLSLVCGGALPRPRPSCLRLARPSCRSITFRPRANPRPRADLALVRLARPSCRIFPPSSPLCVEVRCRGPGSTARPTCQSIALVHPPSPSCRLSPSCDAPTGRRATWRVGSSDRVSVTLGKPALAAGCTPVVYRQRGRCPTV